VRNAPMMKYIAKIKDWQRNTGTELILSTYESWETNGLVSIATRIWINEEFGFNSW
jgi:hypothetical protein